VTAGTGRALIIRARNAKMVPAALVRAGDVLAEGVVIDAATRTVEEPQRFLYLTHATLVARMDEPVTVLASVDAEVLEAIRAAIGAGKVTR
jgi:hypothetical protein